jgi:opacity protein-like surface antigen
MKKMLLALASIALAATVSIAAETDQETREDIAKHRAIAAAHEAAAKCREAGKGEDVCNAQLQAACKGLAIGKFCGMKHEH